ncbi:MAG: polyhydroxyalkanoic acid system family protein [Thermodesulfobacteriota bacterium]|nr:polyhydroxyalkanoic acid system family protein [Thermodesulfobacteriota bacterium]
MAEIVIKRKHRLPRLEVRRLVEPVLEETVRTYGLRCRWQGHFCQVEGAVRGLIKISDDSFLLIAKLGLLASLQKTSIQNQIEKRLDQVLG